MSVSISFLTKCYGRQKAVNQISFSLNEGEICGFLGPNGAGKSTTMKIITGYIDDFEGGVTVCGVDIRKNPIEAKALIGYLPEHNPLYTEMYIREYLAHVARLYGISLVKNRVEEMIELTGLTMEAHKKIGQLSKGYRQRVGLAQALIHDPQVLILDEPMTGLDPNQLDDIRTLILRLAQSKTVMLSTHVMQEVEAICGRIIIINKGEIVADRYKDEITTVGMEAMEVVVSFATSEGLTWLADVDGVANVDRLSDTTFRLIAHPDVDPRIALFNQAAAHETPIVELKSSKHDLQKYFRDLTKG